MSSTWTHGIKLTLFGESHGNGIGMVLDHLPAGMPIDLDKLSAFTARRTAKKGDTTSTARTEPDQPEFLSGIYQGKTTGTPLAAVIHNRDVKSESYRDIAALARPGHADYTGYLRYQGANDPRGGGHFSGRLTAPLTLAGGICIQILEQVGVQIGAHILSIRDITDRAFPSVSLPTELLKAAGQKEFPVLDDAAGEKMIACINDARLREDSVGGVVECGVTGLPAGIGSPMFDGIENTLSSLLFGVPAVKGVSFGDGFDASAHYGSENNDPFVAENGQIATKTNHAGGILGGISTGMPILLRVAFKPTPSISRTQETINLKTGENTTISVHGRHDPCVVARAVPVVEAAAAIGILGQMVAQCGVHITK